MEQQVISSLISNMSYGGLFLWLLLYVLRTNDKREQRYQDIIENLTCKFEEIKEDVRQIKSKLE